MNIKKILTCLLLSATVQTGLTFPHNIFVHKTFAMENQKNRLIKWDEYEEKALVEIIKNILAANNKEIFTRDDLHAMHNDIKLYLPRRTIKSVYNHIYNYKVLDVRGINVEGKDHYFKKLQVNHFHN